MQEQLLGVDSYRRGSDKKGGCKLCFSTVQQSSAIQAETLVEKSRSCKSSC